jgi:hypothetical protein
MGAYRLSLEPAERAELDRWVQAQLATAPREWKPEQVAELNRIRRSLRAEGTRARREIAS